jgi:hypothetical protein
VRHGGSGAEGAEDEQREDGKQDGQDQAHGPPTGDDERMV